MSDDVPRFEAKTGSYWRELGTTYLVLGGVGASVGAVLWMLTFGLFAGSDGQFSTVRDLFGGLAATGGGLAWLLGLLFGPMGFVLVLVGVFVDARNRVAELADDD